MKSIIIAITVLLMFAGVASAAPFLVCDPNPAEDEVRWFKITNIETGETLTTDYGNQHSSGGMIVVDFAEHEIAPGEISLEIRAVNLAGESPPTDPFVFIMPSAAPQSSTNIGLTP